MKYIECPEADNSRYAGEKSLFISGGISNCENWQMKFVNLLKNEDLVLINPRRKSYELDRIYLEEEQIEWEFEYLKKASATSFWFTKESLCPITLFELGKQITKDKPIFIGMHPEYGRRKNIEKQVALEKPEVKIVYSLEELAEQVKHWVRQDLIRKIA